MRRESAIAVAACLVLLPILARAADAPARVEHSKSLPPPGDSLGTSIYKPTAAEEEATKGWKGKELAASDPQFQTLKGAVGRRVAWFGIVRGMAEDKKKNETRLRVEMKYFDGLTDIHQQIVSISGAGDFQATIAGIGHKLKKLSLVRVYGKVVGDDKGEPVVAADFVRCWDWGQFAFMPYGSDKSNPEWVKLRKVKEEDVYESRPDRAYYEQRLGNR